jgi:hypothetical protein
MQFNFKNIFFILIPSVPFSWINQDYLDVREGEVKVLSSEQFPLIELNLQG